MDADVHVPPLLLVGPAHRLLNDRRHRTFHRERRVDRRRQEIHVTRQPGAFRDFKRIEPKRVCTLVARCEHADCRRDMPVLCLRGFNDEEWAIQLPKECPYGRRLPAPGDARDQRVGAQRSRSYAEFEIRPLAIPV